MTQASAKPIRVAVIPAAGLGTRSLPFTKTVPKALLPIVDVPAIQIVVEEAVAAGIEQIVLITSRGQSALEDYFDAHPRLEATLAARDKAELLARVRATRELAEVICVRQAEPKGLGHAVMMARAVVAGRPFAALLPDDLFDSEPAALAQLTARWNQTGVPVVGLMEVPEGTEHRYGIAAGPEKEPGVIAVDTLVEKPKPGTAPSRLGIPGRYVLPASLFDTLAETKPGAIGEVQLTDALVALSRAENLEGLLLTGTRYDVGDAMGYLTATLNWALKRPELEGPLRAHLEGLAGAGEG